MTSDIDVKLNDIKSDHDIGRLPDVPSDNDEPPSVVQRGGYEYQFVQGMDDNLEDIFMCKICHLPSRDPQLSVCCGHTFCKRCLDVMQQSASSNSEICPVCRDDKGFGVVPNKQVDRKIRSLHVFCVNKEKGCEWQGELNDLDAHLNSSCMYEVVECILGCGEPLRRQYLSTHMLSDCLHRMINCQYCNLSGTYSFITGYHKLTECPKVVIPCPNHCEADNIPREDIDKHRKVCSLEVVSCKYMKLGCGTRFARKEVEKYGKEKVEEHLHLALERIEKLENTMESVVSQLKWSCYLTSEVASGSQITPTIIRITDIANKKKDKARWSSPYFYTANKGYKMYATVTFAESDLEIYTGLGVNKNEDLVWPLRGKFDVSVLNQISDGEHHSRRIIYNERCPDEVAGKDATLARGFRPFISYDQLYRTSSTCQYVKDNSVYIKVSYQS